MRSNDQQIEAKRRERFEVMGVRFANHLGLSSAEKWSDLPANARETISGLRYCNLVKPLIIRDNRNGASVRQLSIKYALSTRAIQHHLSGAKRVESECAED